MFLNSSFVFISSLFNKETLTSVAVYLYKLLQLICFLLNICIDKDDPRGQAPTADNNIKLIINNDNGPEEKFLKDIYNLSIGG